MGLKFPETADEDLHDLRSLLSNFERPLNDPWQRQILALMRKHCVTFYDAAYHALAILEGGWFVTADEKYLKTVNDLRHACHLR